MLLKRVPIAPGVWENAPNNNAHDVDSAELDAESGHRRIEGVYMCLFLLYLCEVVNTPAPLGSLPHHTRQAGRWKKVRTEAISKPSAPLFTSSRPTIIFLYMSRFL